MITSNSFCKAITAVRTNVANLSDAALWKIKRARFARNRQKSVRSLRDSVKGPAESKRALSLPETLTSKIRWVSSSILPLNVWCLSEADLSCWMFTESNVLSKLSSFSCIELHVPLEGPPRCISALDGFSHLLVKQSPDPAVDCLET